MNARRSASLLELLDSLPLEVVRMIYQFAGPLAMFLHTRLDASAAAAQASLLWAECFSFDLVAVAPLLPRSLALTWELELLHSRRMLAAIVSLPGLVLPRTALPLSLSLSLASHPECSHSSGLHAIDRPSLLSDSWITIETPDKRVRQAHAHGASHLLLSCLLRRCHPLATNIPTLSHSSLLLLLFAAVGASNVNVVRLLFNAGSLCFDDWEQAARLAADLGCMTAVQTLCDGHPSLARSCIVGALDSDNLRIAQFAWQQHHDALPRSFLDARDVQDAIQKQHNKTLLWLLDATRIRDSSAVADIRSECVRCGNLTILEFALSNGIGDAVEPEALYDAVARGDLVMLRHVHSFGGVESWPTDLLQLAICARQLETAQWLHSNNIGSETTGMDDLLRQAISACDLDALRWLHEDLGQPLPSDAVDLAMQGNAGIASMQMLEYLLIQGCVCEYATCRRMAVKGRLEAVQIMFQHPHLSDIDWNCIKQMAERNGSSRTATWLAGQLGDRRIN